MNPTPYCPQHKTPAYLAMLHFSRLTAVEGDAKKIEGIIEAINSLPTSDLPIRPLIPLIYQNAQKAELFADLTPDAQLFLRQHSLILVGIELANQQWLKAAMVSLGINDIPIILLKGAAFANNLYAGDAPRPGVDLDFLVRKSDFTRACDILSESMTEVVLAEDRLATHQTLFERIYVPKDRSAPTVEIHRGLTNPHIFSIDEEALWSESESHPASNSENVRVLSPEHTLLHLAVHAFRDMDFCNHNLLDAHELICQRGINEEALLRSATEWGARTTLYYLLHNTHALMATPIGVGLLAKLHPGRFRKWIHQKLLQSSALQGGEKNTRYRAAQLASQLALPDSIASAIKFQAHYASTRIKDLTSG